jgi:hypothetical protein
MLCGIALRNAPAVPGMASSAAIEPAPADWPNAVTLSGVAAERGDVVAYPGQRGELIEQAAGVRCTVQT